jgi:hypothetical protein
MGIPDPDVAGDLNATASAPRAVAAAAPEPVRKAPVADGHAPDGPDATVAQEPASAKAAGAASEAVVDGVTAPTAATPEMQAAAAPEAPHASAAASPAEIVAAPAPASVNGENAAPSDPTPPVPGQAPSPILRPDVAASSGPGTTGGQAEERNTGLAAVSAAPDAAAGHDGTTASSADAAANAARLPPDILALLLERGAAMLADGDVSAARKVYTRAADGGSSLAAEELGKTYDPKYLADRHVVGMQPDPMMAASWYRRAVALGDAGAAGLLQRVDGIARQ